METLKSPLKANYCRLPVKSRAEKLFDQIITKTTFADLSNNLELHRDNKKVADYSKQKQRTKTGVQPKCDYKKSKKKTIVESSCSSSSGGDSSVSSDESFCRIKSKPKRKVKFVTYAGKKGVIRGNKKDQGTKKTCIRKKEVPQCTKEAVLDAFLKAGLPDYEAIAALPLNVVVMDKNRKTEDDKKQKNQSDHISRRQIVKPFIPLLKKIDSISRDTSLSKDNPAINVESPSREEDLAADEDDILVDSDAETIADESAVFLSAEKGASTPIPNSKRNSLPKLDLSCIPANTSKENCPSKDDGFATPSGPPPNKKKPWNVTDRRGTDLLPPHPVVFDKPLIISNDSIEVSNDQPLNWSKVHSIAEMDESIHSVFSVASIHSFQKAVDDSLAIQRVNQPTRGELNKSPSYYRRSIVETAHAFHALGKSCRTIVREPTIRRSTRKRKTSIIDNQAVSFLVAFDKSYLEDEEDKQLPVTSKDKVLSLCDPPKITTFNNALDASLMKSIYKIGEGSYGEVFKSKTNEDREVVVKVVPLISTSTEDDQWSQILPELVISLTFGELMMGRRNRTPNFISTLRASCASGCWPEKLVDAWEEYHKQKESENMHPNKYGPDSNWLIILLDNGGVELENFKFHSAREALSVILQTTLSLAAAEEEFEFEHRDLHTGNVLIMANYPESILEYKVNNKLIKLPSMDLKVSVIDYTLARMSKEGYVVYDDLSKYADIFTGEGDYQFEIYRLMRQQNGNDWKRFTPFTNILWVHYLTWKLLNDKKYVSKSKAHRDAFGGLKSLKENLLNYNSTSQFVQSSYFNSIISKLS